MNEDTKKKIRGLMSKEDLQDMGRAVTSGLMPTISMWIITAFAAGLMLGGLIVCAVTK